MDAEKVTVPGLARAQGSRRVVADEARDGHRLRRHVRPARRRGRRRRAPRRRLARHGRPGQATTLPGHARRDGVPLRAGRRGAARALVVGDLPFGSYQVEPAAGRRSTVRLVKEGGASAVKLEGGVPMAETIEAHHPGRHPGDGPHRPDAAERPPHGRPQGAGPRAAAGAASATAARRRQGRRGGRRVRGRARGHAARPGGRDHGQPLDPDHRHRRRARSATARCSCSTTCSG